MADLPSRTVSSLAPMVAVARTDPGRGAARDPSDTVAFTDDDRRRWLIQALPAALALVAVLAGG